MVLGGERGAQPFAHLGTPLEGLYRAILVVFLRAKDRFVVHLRPEDVAAELGRGADEALVAALEKLVEWGNLRADADTGRVTSVEDFHRKRFLFQLTPQGHAAEQAIALYEEVVGQRGALQSVALADIAERLAALEKLAAQPDPDPAQAHLLLLALAERFTSLADNAQAFMASLRRAIDFSDGDVEGFITYKERLIDYINRFISDLANSGARIAGLLVRLEELGHERLLLLAARREAADAVPDGADAAAGLARAEREAFEAWRNRWRGLSGWFVSTSGHSSQSRLLRQSAVGAIKQLIDAVGLLNERRSGRSDRSADFRALARWFAEAPDDASAHRIWRAAFGLNPARHLTVTGATLDAWRDAEPDSTTPWAEAPPLRISPQLRKTGAYERRGRQAKIRSRAEEKRHLRELADREAAETAEARARLCTDGPVPLSALDVLDPKVFRLFLALLGDALSARAPGETEVRTITADGSFEVRLSPVPDGGEIRVRTEDGVLSGPEHLIEITDLMGTS
ncbi:TIGR02677 family protein [Actinocorallia sp. API 0066]|uniref:TIGR02677 family protein n=1 Tax=Actinocorallia sp. API 0066 TaxID=2896846 RepID=UPI001E65AE12|nr:TIGR02677 family protein [Actinocorallia sp. API 0066]MCD0450478.1 TIGR02677 family protein [Actinocorallia sp. API 0066]